MKYARFTGRALGFTLVAFGIVAGSVYTARHRARVLLYRDLTAELNNLTSAYREQLRRAADESTASTAVTSILAKTQPIVLTSSLGEVRISVAHNGHDLSGTARCWVTSSNYALLAILRKMLDEDSKGLDVFGLGDPQPVSVNDFRLLFGIKVLPNDHPHCIAADAKLQEAKANR